MSSIFLFFLLYFFFCFENLIYITVTFCLLIFDINKLNLLFHLFKCFLFQSFDFEIELYLNFLHLNHK